MLKTVWCILTHFIKAGINNKILSRVKETLDEYDFDQAL